jgi:hypothetical protein
MSEDPRVALRAQVKLARTKVERLRQESVSFEERLRGLLSRGERKEAERAALTYQDHKEDRARAEAQLAQVEAEEARLGAQLEGFGRRAKRARGEAMLGRALGGLADALGALSGPDSGDAQLEQLERRAALDEARLDLALEESSEHAPPTTAPSGAADLLRQIELDMNIEGPEGLL